MAEQGRNMLLN